MPSTLGAARYLIVPLACLYAAMLAVSCGGGESTRGVSAAQETSALTLDDASNEIVLTNHTDRLMLFGPGYNLEERTQEGWMNADRTVEGITGEPEPDMSILKLSGIGPGTEQRYPISYLDQLPPGDYRVTVVTGDDDPENALDTPQRLTFTK